MGLESAQRYDVCEDKETMTMTWKFRITWREREKKGAIGSSLPGLYDLFEAKRVAKNLRKQYPDRLFWLSNTKSTPTVERITRRQ